MPHVPRHDASSSAAAVTALSPSFGTGVGGSNTEADPPGAMGDTSASASAHATPSAGSSDVQQSLKAFQRAYKACDACRFRKVRCDLGSVEQPLDPPCRRCRRERRDCTFDKGTRGRPKGGLAHANVFEHGVGHGHAYADGSGNGNGSVPTPAAWSHLPPNAARGGASGSTSSSSQMLPPPQKTFSAGELSATAATGQSPSQHDPWHPAYPSSHHHHHHHQKPAMGRSHSSSSIPSAAPSALSPPMYAPNSGSGGTQNAVGLAHRSSGAGANSSDAAGSDTSSPTAHASLALINLRNSSEAMKALTTVGVREVIAAAESPVPTTAGKGPGTGAAAGSPAASERSAASDATANANASDAASSARKRKCASATGAGTAEEEKGRATLSKTRRADAGAAPRTSTSASISIANGVKTVPGVPAAAHAGPSSAVFASAVQHAYANVTHVKPKRLQDWRDFEPVRLKIIKASETRYLFKYFFQHIHSFSPLCSERYMRNTKESRSELISREPLLLGAILSIASRFCIGPDQDAAANALDGHDGYRAKQAAHSADGTSSGGGGAKVLSAASVAAEKASFGLELHQRISHWTHQLAGRVLVDCSLHSVGSVEALLLLSEWSTWGIHSNRQDMLASSDSEEDDDEEDEDEEMDVDVDERVPVVPRRLYTNGTAADGDVARSSDAPSDAVAIGGSSKVRRRGAADALAACAKKGARASPRRKREASRPSADVIATTIQRFDSMSWMFVGMAIRLAEELDLPKHEKCFGIYSQDHAEVEQAERRLRVWLDCVRADTQISIRLGRRFTSGGLSPEWMELMRARTYRLPDTVADPAMPTNGSSNGHSTHPTEAAAAAAATHHQPNKNCNFTFTDDLVGAARQDPAVNEARKWTAWRGHAELANKLRNVHDMLNESDARTASMMENDRFESILRPFRNDLDSWVKWLEPKIGYPGGGMRTLDIRVDYHFTRLQAFRVALDALVLRARRIGRPDGLAALGEGLSDRPTFPFAKESVDAARTLAIVISVDLQSLRCAPPRFFLYLVLAVMVCMQACELSESLMLPMQCASILRDAINALNSVAVDERHLARRYALMLRNAGKRLLLAEEAEAATATAAAGAGARARSESHLISDLGLLNGQPPQHHQQQQHQQRTLVPTISVAPRPPQPAAPPVQMQGPSFADDVLAPTHGVDLEDLWSWLGNIDQAVPSASTEESVTDGTAEHILSFDSLYEGQSAPFFFPNTALNQ
ncbi:hypothetical protein K437DRAFT_254816 [Tilletiaria anomala UBC 951]|uniref:Zn(2)-C6 fungal-type domain-containing protein n=1 Tax=Tilletiaria anomala (strain ATCC 24038 / CBS 436.72 / UBC 951) TaxID=1037660 RepID=A0A066WBV5_TILAU|nr:uncharacterized protein K437DRAFT_254816 [Tilletiaria anomala UBC 951]KDN51407.1 hypothetical protein K437DRAFT_254816 [Tilletiaria anomala UBC 951]